MDRPRDARSDRGSRAWATSMSVALGLGLGFFVLTAVVGVLAVGLVSGYQNTVELLRQKAELLIASERDLTRQYLEAARNQVDFIAARIAAGEIAPEETDELTSLVTGALAATPQIVRLQFVDPAYRLVGAERRGDDWAPLYQSVRSDEDLKRLADRARQGGTAFWGQPVWREELGEALLNYNWPVIGGGRYLGTVSALVSAARLSEFISDLESDFGANAFILYGRDWVLAHPLMAFGYDGRTRLKPFPEQRVFGDPVIASMWQASAEPGLEERIVTGPGVGFVRFADQGFIVLHRELDGYADRPLLVGTYFQSSDLLSEALRLKWAIVICFAISLLSAVAAAYIGRQIARPVRRLAEGSKRIYNLDLAAVDPIPGSFFHELNEAANSFNAMLEGLRWFERYVPRTLVRRLIRLHREDALESSHREIAVLFTDLVNFSRLSEAMTANAAADFLNRHFTMVADCVEAEGGVVDKYMGDSVMAFWGAPDQVPDQADRACRTALAIAVGVRAFNRAQAAGGGPQIRMRIGIHLGRVVVGNIGSPGRINYTVVGDPVVVAQRLEEAGKQLANDERDVVVLISDAVRAAVMSDYRLTPLGRRRLRGRSDEIEVFALEAAPEAAPEAAATDARRADASEESPA